MNEKKLINKDNFILLFFSLLPVSFIIGNAILELNIIFITLFFLNEILRDQKYLYQFLKSRLFLILSILWIYLIFNSLIGINYENSLRRGAFFFRYIFLVFALIYFLKNEALRNKVINFWTLILLIVSFDIFFEFIYGQNILGFESPMKNERIVSFFQDELIVGSYLSTFLFIIVGRFYFDEKKNLSIILFLIFFISILVTGERSISLKLLFSVFLIIFFVLNNYKLKILALISLILLIILTLSTGKLSNRYKNTFQSINKSFDNQNLYLNILETKYINQSLFSYEILKQRIFFGVGTKNYLKACSELKTTSDREIIKEKVDYCYTHPHQFYYEFISEHGVLGTIIILSLIFTFFFTNKSKVMDKEKQRKLFIFKIYIIISLVPIIPTGSFFSSLNLFQFFLNYALYYVYSNSIDPLSKN
tara:strand:+ start:1271 stop:2530 length:1260 start_codon:yes stop_codon:yes gene_type:complete